MVDACAVSVLVCLCTANIHLCICFRHAHVYAGLHSVAAQRASTKHYTITTCSVVHNMAHLDVYLVLYTGADTDLVLHLMLLLQARQIERSKAEVRRLTRLDQQGRSALLIEVAN
jgi:hypothetical protein